MKLCGFEDIEPGVRAFILITIAIAYPVWDFGFELGAFGRRPTSSCWAMH
jgi:hypothetical protein